MQRVVVGLSGGVDSSVAAYMLQQAGYEVIGLFMKNWHDETVTLSSECPWIDDSNDALLVAEKLGIPFQAIDLSAEYRSRVVDYMFAEYERGRTPNPDVLCNREIKFDIFLKTALSLGADFVATGHYCQKTETIHGDQTTYTCWRVPMRARTKVTFCASSRRRSSPSRCFRLGIYKKKKCAPSPPTLGWLPPTKKTRRAFVLWAR